MKHAVLLPAVLLYVVVMGQNWTWYAGALMVAAIVTDWRKVHARAGQG